MRFRIGRSRGRLAASAAAVILMAAGTATAAAGLGVVHAPWDEGATSPTTSATSAMAAPAQSTSAPVPDPASYPTPSVAVPAPPSTASDPVLAASVPGRLQVPAVGIDTPLMRLGKQPDGEVQVPPAEPGSPAGWYTGSPSPGQSGSAVILGHVNAIGTPIGVFYRLHELTAGQQATVVRSDGIAEVFAVDRVETYHKANFPTIDVYRNADRPELRMITCSGYDPASGQFLDNTVVYAHLVATHPS